MKKHILYTFIAFALGAFVSSCDTTVQVTGTFSLEQDKKIVATLVELSPEKPDGDVDSENPEGNSSEAASVKNPIKSEIFTLSQDGFSFELEIPKPALYGLYIRVGEGNELSGYNTTLYLQPGDNISLEFVPSGKYGVKCRHSSISDANNKALVALGEITNSIMAKNFNNPPVNIEGEKAYLNSFIDVADSLLGLRKVKPLVNKFIRLKAIDSYYSAYYRSSLKEIPDFKNEYFDDDFIFLFPSGIQNLVGFLNLKTGLSPYSRRKDLSMISAQIGIMDEYISNQRVTDMTISHLLSSYITSYRDFDNYKTNREAFASVADMVSDMRISGKLKESFEQLGYTVVGSQAPPIQLEDRNGNQVSLDSFKGKIVVVDVWATWCVPCLRQMPRLKELEHEMKDRNVIFVGICMGSKKEDWLQKLEEFELDSIQLFDAGDKFAKALNINAVPHILIYDQETRLQTYQTTINQLPGSIPRIN